MQKGVVATRSRWGHALTECQRHMETVGLSGEEMVRLKQGRWWIQTVRPWAPAVCALCSVGNGSTRGFPWRLEREREGSVQSD